MVLCSYISCDHRYSGYINVCSRNATQAEERSRDPQSKGAFVAVSDQVKVVLSLENIK